MSSASTFHLPSCRAHASHFGLASQSNITPETVHSRSDPHHERSPAHQSTRPGPLTPPMDKVSLLELLIPSRTLSRSKHPGTEETPPIASAYRTTYLTLKSILDAAMEAALSVDEFYDEDSTTQNATTRPFVP